MKKILFRYFLPLLVFLLSGIPASSAASAPSLQDHTFSVGVNRLLNAENSYLQRKHPDFQNSRLEIIHRISEGYLVVEEKDEQNSNEETFEGTSIFSALHRALSAIDFNLKAKGSYNTFRPSLLTKFCNWYILFGAFRI